MTNPVHKSVTLKVRGVNYEAIVTEAMMQAADFLQLPVTDLKVANVSPAKVVKYSRFTTEVVMNPHPELFEASVTVSADIPSPHLESP